MPRVNGTTRRAVLGAMALATASRAAARLGDGKAIRFVPSADLELLDPLWTTSYTVRNYGLLVFDTLYALDSRLEPRPQMAEDHEQSEDGLTWTIRLRAGLEFHDGTPVRARDCTASLARWALKNGFGAELAARTELVDAVDDRTLRFHLSHRIPLLPAALATASTPMPFILPARLAPAGLAQPVREPIGSGPFRFVADEWVSGSRIVWSRFDRYRPRDEPADGLAGGKRAQIDRIEWHIIPDPATALAALESGEVDWLELLPPDLIASARGRSDLTLSSTDPLYYLIRFNCLFPPFDDPLARRAVMAAIDQDGAAAAMGGGAGLAQGCKDAFACGTPLSAGIGERAMTGDTAAARALLARSRYDGRPVVLLQPAEPMLSIVCDVLAATLRRLSMPVTVKRCDAASFYALRASQRAPEDGGWNLFPAATSASDASSPATDILLRGNGRAGWPGWFEDADLERLRREWFSALDDSDRRRIATEIDQRIFTTAPFAPVAEVRVPMVYRNGLSGVSATTAPIFWNVQKE